ncbi:MAG: winged helix-turn-helix transcriptional regulator [Clostridia bacterium]|nr:winged helix-turn-helix transcriptional regulator [Clostridia bacterium]
MDKLWSALSDKTRRDILTLLHEGEKNAGDIAAHFKISKPSISHHLSVLREANLVYSRKEGQTIIYALNKTALRDASRFISSLTR